MATLCPGSFQQAWGGPLQAKLTTSWVGLGHSLDLPELLQKLEMIVRPPQS